MDRHDRRMMAIEREIIRAGNRILRQYVRNIRRIVNSKPPPSAPGNPPANDTGEYRNSFAIYEMTKRGRMIEGEVRNYRRASTGVPLWQYLESGTKNKDGSWRMAPRPHLRQAALSVELQILNLYRKLAQ